MIITKNKSELTAEERLAIEATYQCANASLDKLIETWSGHMKNGLASEPPEVVAAMLGGDLHGRMQNVVGHTVGLTIFAAAIVRLAQLKANPQTLSFSA